MNYHVGQMSAANLSFTRFIFIVPKREDDGFMGRLRAAGGVVARGFFNDFEADGSREGQSHETIQFLVAEGETHPDSAMAAARFAVQVSGKYRPRLLEVESDLRRRVGDVSGMYAIEGALRSPIYTSSTLHEFAYKPAGQRRPGRQSPVAMVLPISKSQGWWQRDALERHAFFYPHVDPTTGCAAPGHARAAEEGIAVLYRRLFHNPDGYERPGEYDFITYFECAPEHVATFDRVHAALRDTSKNPEWRFVTEGPLWKGRRVLRW